MANLSECLSFLCQLFQRNHRDVSPSPPSDNGNLPSQDQADLSSTEHPDPSDHPSPSSPDGSTKSDEIVVNGLIKHISQLWNRIDKEEPTSGQYWNWPPGFLDFVTTGKLPTRSPNAGKTSDGSALKVIAPAVSEVEHFLEVIGTASLATAGFLLIAYGLGKYLDISANKEECRNILEEMDFLAKLVLQCEERCLLKNDLKDATGLIIEASKMYYSQMKSSPFSKFVKTEKTKDDLVSLRQKLNAQYSKINIKIGISIVDKVMCRDKPRLSRGYPEHAVGIEKSIKEVTNLLEWGTQNKNKVVAVILYGFGGTGKTTLADAVFNRVDITGCKYSHVQLVQSTDSTPQIIKMQKKILQDLNGSNNITGIIKYQDGQREIASTLAEVSAFIYIDNVLEKDQLRQLLPQSFDKALKVRLLITARDINVRKACPMTTSTKEYQMRGISSAEIKKLLKEKNPAAANGPLAKEIPLGMLKMLSSIQVNRVIDKCCGIPLMLELVAQELFSAKDKQGQGICEVIEDLEKLEGEEFGEKLESYFLVYDKLPRECKEPFLDVCSFFKGWDWDTVADIVGKTALDRLERRALVAKDTNGVVTVPEVIMEVGRRKAKEMRIRFTSTSQLLNFLQEDEKVEQLRYLRYKPAKDLNQLIEHNLRMPPKLKYMEIDGKLHCDDLEIFHSRLLRLPDLRILKLINFEGLKELPSVLGDLVKGLRELTLSNCKSFKQLPYSISKLRSLRVLKMEGCISLTQLPEDFGLLNSLEKLYITHCYSLKELPRNFGELSSLRELDLLSCKALKHLPDSLDKMTSLVKLSLSHCEKLISIPKSIGNLKTLLSVDISWCYKLKELPNEFCELSLTYLKLVRCTALTKLPDGFDHLKRLRVLKLKSCTSLKNLPEDFSELKYLVHLDLSGCTELEKLCTNFNDLLSLRTLSLDGCKKLKKLPENFHRLCSLQHLNLSNCEVLEGDSMNNVVQTKALQMVYINKSKMLKEEWNQIQGDQSWSFKVDIGQDMTEEEQKHEWEKLSPEFVRLLQNGQVEPFHLSNCSPNTTILLVMFDGCFDFNQDFPWPLIEETIDDIDDIQIDFEIIYIGKHFNKLPKRVADRISGRALDNSDARLLLEKVFFTLKRNGQSLWPQKMGKFFSMSTKIMNKGETEGRVEQNGDKYVSSWTLLSDCEMEKFVLEKCGRYIWLKKHAEKKQESNIQLLRELFENGGEDISLLRNSDKVRIKELRGRCPWLKQLPAEKQGSNIPLLRELFENGGDDISLLRKSGKVGIDELKGKTILLEIRPADASYDIRLQSLKNLYIAEKDRSNLEIISIPVGQQNIGSKQFSGEIPWLVLQNPWSISRVVKYFLIKACEWEDKDGEISKAWYPSRMIKIELNSKVSYMPAILAMLERWGPKAYPFSSGKIEELKEEDWNERKWMSMSSLEFLLKPFMPELAELKEVMHLQSKMICLICNGKHPRTQRVRTKTFDDCIKSAMKDVMEDIHFIYVPHYQEKEDNKLTVTDSIKVPHFPIEGSSMAELELKHMAELGFKHLSSLQQWDAMRFWMRVCDLRKEIKGMDKNDKQLQGLERLLDTLDRGYLSMAVIEHDGEVVTSKGRQIVDIFYSIRKGSGKGKATKKVELNKEDEFAGIKDEENESGKGTARKMEWNEEDVARMVKDVKEEGEEARKFVEYMIKGSEAKRKGVWVKLENKLK